LVLLALAGGAALALWTWRRSPAPPLDRFRRAAASLSTRPVDGRLSGWPHLAPQRAVRSAMSSTPPALMRLRGIAGDTLLTSRDPHDVAVARLIAGDTTAAIEAFRGAAGKSNDADFWNDYAVACITRSDEIDDPTLAIDAVSACDHALAIDARHAAAHFNRGLALTRLGLLTSAADEWKRAAANDPGSPWAAEALQLAHDVPPNTLDGWTHALPHIAQLDAKQLDALVRAYPQQARTYGEGICMTEWADAILAGDAAKAEQRLTLARHISDTLRTFSGESLLHDAVIAAYEANSQGTARTLATAYTIYRNGRIAHSKQDGAKAEAELRRAEPLFVSVHSPMALVARYYTGSVLYAQTRTDESEAVLSELAAHSLEARGYVALAAQTGWERGLCALARGSVSDAVDIFTKSRTLFERIGEVQFVASMSLMIASAYDFTSASSNAWRARRDAFRTLSTAGDTSRMALALTTSATVATRDGNAARGLPLFEMAEEAAERGRNAQLTSIAYARRSSLFSEIGDRAAAARDLQSARKWLATVHVPAPQTQADLAFAEGKASMPGDPAQAVAQFARASAFYEAAAYRVELPRIQLESARAERALGHVAEARKHMSIGIDILESERRGADVDQRATLFSGANQLFQEAIDLALVDGDEAGAFNLADQQRARALLDEFSKGPVSETRFATPLTAGDIQTALSTDSAVIEYTVLPHRFVAFIVRADRLRVVTFPATTDSVIQAGKRLSYAVEHGDDVVAPGTAAFVALLQPLWAEISDARRVVFVAPEDLATVPFAALHDPVSGRFLIETTSILEAPSATLAITAARRAMPPAKQRVLAIAASRFDSQSFPNAQPLTRVETQAKKVAAEYRNATVISADQATRSQILREVGNYTIVDIGGHAVVPTTGDRDAALLLAPSPQQRSTLRASEIAQLRLPQAMLVVLAACRSAATSSYGNGNENLAIAFVAAGASTVVATTTDLDDSDAVRMMPRFHHLIASGQSPDEALRNVLSVEISESSAQGRSMTSWACIKLIGGTADLIRTYQHRR
jgi:CHAT domain-containing protein